MVAAVDELLGGEFNSQVPAIRNVWSRSYFESGEMMANGDSKFFCHKGGMWRNNSGADDAAVAIGDDFDETMR